MTGFDIGECHVGDGAPCFIIAEVGLAHDGSLQAAHAYIDAVARAGVDAVKFQCHDGDPVDQWRVEPAWTNETRQQYWKRTGFTPEQWEDLRYYADCFELEFLCSPFSVEAVKVINPLVKAWKVPSGMINNVETLEAIAVTEKPVLLSTGMCTEKEWAIAYDRFVLRASLHCTSLYPTPPDRLGLVRLAWNRGAGLSDHSGTIYPGIAAAALGAAVVEVHVCFSKEQGGFDTAASLDMGQLAQLVEGIRFVEEAMRPVDKDEMAKELSREREIFMGVK